MPARPSLEAKRYSAESLARNFGSAAQGAARDGVPTFYAAIRAGSRQAKSSLCDWKVLFGEVCGYDLDHPSDKIKKLARHYGIGESGLAPAELLLALHTYYATFMKLLAAQIVAFSHDQPAPLQGIIHAPTGAKLQHEMESLEAGVIFAQLGITNFLAGDPFGWYTNAWSGEIEQLIRNLATRLDEYSPATLSEDPAGSRDLLKSLYQQLFPRSVRRHLGEYYTPDWMAEHVLNELQYAGDPDQRLLDPACGSGTFLVLAIARNRRWYDEHREQHSLNAGDLGRKILANVVGCDLNPLAVMAARTNYLIAIRDLIGQVEQVEIPVYLCDSILAPPPLLGERFDYVAGNPPWIVWDNLPPEYRAATKPLWEKYGLFSLSASAARHGGGKKDLSMLMLYSSIDRYLSDGGLLGFVITQSLFQTKGAGDGFRRFRLGTSGPQLGVLRVNDMVRFQPFDGAANWTSTVLIKKGTPTKWPVPYRKWDLVNSLPSDRDPDWQRHFSVEEWLANPIDRTRENSPWMVQPLGVSADILNRVGDSDYQGHLGANSGGANGVYWVKILNKQEEEVVVQNVSEKSKTVLESVTCPMERRLLYPLIRWKDVSRYGAAPSAHLILAQDPQTRTGIPEGQLRSHCPQTYAYLSQFKSLLESRAAYRRYQGAAPFYSMYDIGKYTLAPIKVVRRRMDNRINAAVVAEIDDPLLGRRPVIPQETCVLVACKDEDEAHYICAYMNSLVVNYVVKSHSVRGGKGFGTPGMLHYIGLKAFRQGDPEHQRLSGLSRAAHELALVGGDLAAVQGEIDESVASLWGVARKELALMRRAIE